VGQLPDEIIARFRTVSAERLGRVESALFALSRGVGTQELETEMLRDVHTLKGDAKLVSFDEVHSLCHKLEDLLLVAQSANFVLEPEVDLVLTMNIHFIGMLMKQEQASKVRGIDVPGFLRQVDETVREARTAVKSAPRRDTGITTLEHPDRVSVATRERLGAIAASVFVESHLVGPEQGHRLFKHWEQLCAELAKLGEVSLASVVERHVDAASTLGAELGKTVRLECDLGGASIEAKTAEQLEVALLHVIRNAVDHGIEYPHARLAAGKSECGTITVEFERQAGRAHLHIRDDGAGIDVGLVRQRVIDKRLASADELVGASDDRILDYLFAPGFSTTRVVTDVSGRGIGLNAVKSDLARIGGGVTLTTRLGSGTTISLTVTEQVGELDVFRFTSPLAAIPLALPASWSPRVLPATPPQQALDVLAMLEVVEASAVTATDAMALHLTDGARVLMLQSACEPKLATALRCCPTPTDHATEVVLIDGEYVLMLRPDILSPATA